MTNLDNGNCLKALWSIFYKKYWITYRTHWFEISAAKQLMFFAGNILFGVVADRYGRKRTLMICIFIQSTCGIISSWTPWYWSFILFRFLLALANGGTMITSFVMCMEVVGGVWRTVVPILYQIPFGLGNSIMAGLAFTLRDWRHLQMTLSSLSALYILYLW